MQILNMTSQIDKRGHLKLDIPTRLPQGDVELILVFNSIVEKEKGKIAKYNFENIIGKLKWTGDAVKEQRRLRDEW